MQFLCFNDQASHYFVLSFFSILISFPPFLSDLFIYCQSFFGPFFVLDPCRNISSFLSLLFILFLSESLFPCSLLVSDAEAILSQSLFSHILFPAAFFWSAMQELLTRNSQFEAECLLSSSYIVEPNQLLRCTQSEKRKENVL